MKRIILIVAMALSLQGWAIAAMPVAAQIPIGGSIVGAAAAVGDLTVNAFHDCHRDRGCKSVPVPP